jgi:hypothetical protein
VTQKFPASYGSKHIEDLLNVRPEEIDLDAIDLGLKSQRRFANHPNALTIHQHRHLVCRMVREDREAFAPGEETDRLHHECCRWAHHHDDHEGIIGDIIYPVKALISSRTNILEIAEVSIDKAICGANGFEYPNDVIRRTVLRYDRACATLEWKFTMGREPSPHNTFCDPKYMDRGAELIEWARQHV